MPPKTPSELKEQLERENAAGEASDATEGRERTAEGLEVPTPTREDFVGNLEKVSRPQTKDGEG